MRPSACWLPESSCLWSNTGVLLKDSLKAAIERLTAANVGSPRLNAETLLMFVLGCDRAYLHAHPERGLTAEQNTRYDQALSQRCSGIPAQYITGHQEFWGMDFIVNPAVLIPRPETEHIIETVLPLTRSLAKPRIVDVGTGSGCIAIVLAKELGHASIHATDISPAALEVARANATRLQMQKRVQFHQGNLLDGFEPGSFDLVVSNPPYVGRSEEDQVQLEVRKFEPPQAVFAGETGIEIIAQLVPQAQTVLKSGGRLVLEISGTIVKQVEAQLKHWGDVSVVKDLQQIPRVVLAQKA
jgi:release factor glutamine methyltransferase